MKSIRVEREAFDDLRAAAVWYEQQRPGLSRAFLDQFAHVQEQISQNPRAFPIYAIEARRALMHRFPYLVLFIEQDEFISIVGVFHTSREPAVVRKRV